MNKMDIVEKEAKSKKTPVFRVGDTLKVHVRVKEGDKTRTQLLCVSLLINEFQCFLQELF